MSDKKGDMMRKMVQEKRKSAVLIAAQSLDLEVQNVKNLKRLSVGSMDLLIDPELEYKMTNINGATTPSRRNVRNSGLFDESVSVSEPNSTIEDRTLTLSNISDISNENSFDKTGIEYLHHEEDFTVKNGFEPSTDFASPKIENHSQLRRGLSGVGTFKNCSFKHSDLKQSAKSIDKEEQITQNLFWVPANKHPNVKPENYVELLQDTLQTIDLNSEDTQEQEQTGTVPFQLNDKMIMDSEVIRKRRISQELNRNHSSLVRRPTGLRIIYTEFEEDFNEGGDTNKELEYTDDNDENKPANLQNDKFIVKSSSPLDHSAYQRDRSLASLKDITEELTKISNKVGLSSSDAISLARSLSIAGSLSTEEDTSDQNNENHDNNDTKETEFASNILVRNGITIPTRSLRRSKFNTYKIRNPSGVILDQKNYSKSEPSSRNVTSSSNRITSLLNRNKENTFQQNINTDEINTKDSKLHELEYFDTSLDTSFQDPDLSHNSFSNDSFTNSSDSSNDSVLVRPTHSQSILQEKLDVSYDEDTHNTISHTLTERSLSNSVKLEGNGDFLNLAIPERTKSQKVRAEKSNHTKNRHLPIIAVSTTASTKNSIQESNTLIPKSDKHIKLSSKSETFKKNDTPVVSEKTVINNDKEQTNNKKQRFDKKLVSIFKRKSSSKSSSEANTDTIHDLPLVGKTIEYPPTINEPKHIDNSYNNIEPASCDGNIYNDETIEHELLSEDINPSELSISVEVQPRNLDSKPSEIWDSDFEDKMNSSYDEVVDDSFSSFYDTNQTQNSLQPAVSITSSRTDTGSIIETVNELSGEDLSQDISGAALYTEAIQVNSFNSSYDTSYNSTRIGEQENNVLPLSALPPRKLTFDDVTKSERPNGPMEFTDSAFGFPLPKLTASTVIMFDHRLPVNIERAIYRLSHLKLSDTKRELREQILLSNFMYAYLHLVNHSLYIEQSEQQNGESLMNSSELDDSQVEAAYMDESKYLQQNQTDLNYEDYLNNETSRNYHTETNNADGSICIPDLN